MTVTKSANPVLKEDIFKSQHGGEVMTLSGTLNKTFLLLLVLVVSAWFTWDYASQSIKNMNTLYGWTFVVAIINIVVVIFLVLKPHLTKSLSIVYAALEGFMIALISLSFERMFPGVVMKAVLLTFAVALLVLLIYRTGIIKVTKKFQIGLMAALGGIMLIYFMSWIFNLFGWDFLSGMVYGNSGMGIGFSFFVVIIASMNLVLDYDFIRKASEAKAPKLMEWYGAFSLTVTLVWLYIEILHLLAKVLSRE